MKNNKGFTLVELLATISILAIIMLLAVPNVVSVVQNSRNNTYVEDAKKMVALAKYEIKVDSVKRKKLNENNSICLSLGELDKSKEIKDGPNGNVYDRDNSRVIVEKTNNIYEYKVRLVEPNGDICRGINNANFKNLSQNSVDDIQKCYAPCS